MPSTRGKKGNNSFLVSSDGPHINAQCTGCDLEFTCVPYSVATCIGGFGNMAWRWAPVCLQLWYGLKARYTSHLSDVQR